MSSPVPSLYRQILRLNIPTKSVPRSFAEFEADFFKSDISFGQKSKSSLVPHYEQSLQKDVLDIQHKSLPGIESQMVDVMIGVHVDYHCEEEDLVRICQKIENFAQNKTVFVLLILDGIEVLDRSPSLINYFFTNHFSDWNPTPNLPCEEPNRRSLCLSSMRHACSQLNYEEKNTARDRQNEPDCALVLYKPDSTSAGSEGKMSVFTVVKPRQRGKLHSDLWLFAGFAQFFETKYVLLLDYEITPEPNALKIMYDRLELELRNENPTLLGIFAAPEVDTEYCSSQGRTISIGCKSCSMIARCLLKPLIKPVVQVLKWADWFEVLYSQMMYTPLENLGGYISFPAVRFVMLRWSMLSSSNVETHEMGTAQKALMEYFKPMIAGHDLNWLDSNLYEFVPGLFLCLEARLFSQDMATFAFDSRAVGKWRMPSRVVRWIDYRSRVINVSFLSFIKAIAQTQFFGRRIGFSLRTFGVMFEFYFFAIAFVFKWLAIGTFYVLSSMAVRKVFPAPDENSEVSGRLLNNSSAQNTLIQTNVTGIYVGWKYIYLLVLVVTFFMSLGKQGDRGKYFWLLVILLNVLQSFFNFGILFINIIENNVNEEETSFTWIAITVMLVVIVSFPVGMLVYQIPIRQWLKFISTGVAYLITLPVYVNVLTIYSICNTSDDCWGLSVISDSWKRSSIRSVYSVRKNMFLILFIIMNLIFGVTWETLDIHANQKNVAHSAFLVFYFVGVLVIVLPVGLLQVVLKLVGCCSRPRPSSFSDDDRVQLRAPAIYPGMI